MKKTLVGISLIFLLTFAPTTHAQVSTDSLLAQIQSLLALVQQLQQQLATLQDNTATTPTAVTATSAPSTNSTSLCFPPTTTFYLGAKGTDTTRLQTFLRTTGDFTYPEITGYYGNVTAQAVQRYQCRFMGICSGDMESNGYGLAGPSTRRYMCSGTENSTSPYTPVTHHSCETNSHNTTQTRTRFLQSNPPEGTGCQQETQTRTCTDGSWSQWTGTYQNNTCTTATITTETTAQTCTFSAQAIQSGQSVTAYQASTVPYGSQCVSQQRTCTNGTLSGTYTHSTCSVATSAPQAVWSGSLLRSDVLLSPRFGSFSIGAWRTALADFKANRIVWTYAGVQIAPEATGLGVPVQCTFPFWVPATHARAQEMKCTDKTGVGIVPGSDPNITLVFQDMNSDAWREYVLAQSKQLVDAGCTSLQQDDAAWNFHLAGEERGTGSGCYSPDSVRKFREYLKQELTPSQIATLGIQNIDTFDYRTNNLPSLQKYWGAFHKKSVEEYHTWLHREVSNYIQTKFGRSDKVFFSANMQSRFFPWLAPYFDFSMAEVRSYAYETPSGDRNGQLDVMRQHSRQQQEVFPGQVSAVTFPFTDVWLNKRSIASAYALGLVTIVPWDVYIPFGNPRFFGSPSDYANLYNMVRMNKSLFDMYRSSSDEVGTYTRSAIPSQGYVTEVDRTTFPDRTTVRWTRSSDFKITSKDQTIHIGNIPQKVISDSTVGDIYLIKGAAVSVGDPVYISGTPKELVTVRTNTQDTRKKAVHVVSWRQPSSTSPDGEIVLFIHLKKSEFPVPPNRIVTNTQQAARSITPISEGDYYIYPVGYVMWAVVFAE